MAYDYGYIRGLDFIFYYFVQLIKIASIYGLPCHHQLIDSRDTDGKGSSELQL